MDEVDQMVLEEVTEMHPITAAAVAEAIGEPIGVVRRALARLEVSGLVDAEKLPAPMGADWLGHRGAKWGPKGWGENP